MEFYQQIGRVALGSRIRHLGELIGDEATEIYRLYGIEMNPKWFPVFYTLSQNHGLGASQIAKRIGHSHVSVGKIVAEMAAAGLVNERADPEDGRRTLLTLSKKGKEIARKIQEQYLDVEAAVQELSSQAKYDLWKALEEWEELLNKKPLFRRVLEKKKLRDSSNVQIIEYKPRHQAAFKKLNEEWITTHFKMEKPDHEALDNPKKYILSKGGSIFVALLDGHVVGVCALMIHDNHDYKYELVKMAVSPKHRGKNIGWLLGQAVVEKARTLKADRLYLESNTILKPAIHLYQKLGFKKIAGPATPYERCNIQMELKL